MLKIYRWGAVIALAALMVVPVWAQDEVPETEPAEEPEVVVVVTAERTVQPASESIASTTVVTARQIKEQGAQTVADVLRLVPGVTLRQSGDMGSRATVFVRGTKSNQVLVLLDGERISSPAFIATDLSKLPIADVSRVEVLRGPASSLYGSEAIGGVINIITKKLSGSTGDLTLGLGSHGRQERSLSLRSGGEKMSWQLVTSVPAYEGPRVNNDYSATHVSAKVNIPSVKGWDLSLNGQIFDDSLGLPGSVTYPSPRAHQWWTRTSIGLTGSRDLSGGQLQWNVYRNRQKLDQVDPDWFTDSKVTGLTNAGEITYRGEAGKHSFVAGLEFRDETYKDIERGTAQPDRSISNRALFAQDRVALGSRMDAVVGLRFDDHSMVGGRMTPRVGVTYALQPGMCLRASYSDGFRSPSLVEMYYNLDGTIGNPNLKPEKSRQYEIGINLERGKDAFDLAVFLNHVKDQIEWISVDTDNDPNTWEGTYDNINRARQRGLELAWTRRFSKTGSLGLSYTYAEAIDRATGARLLGVPHNHLTLTASEMINSWQVGLSGRWTDKIPDYGGSAGSHVVFDLTLQRRDDKPTNPYIVVRNLFNTSYEEVYGYPAEGISIEAGMRTTW